MAERKPVYRVRAEVVAALMRHGGTIKHAGGRATSRLVEEMAAYGWHANIKTFGHLLSDMEEDGQILRDTKAKRTYEIALGDVPDNVMRRVKDLGLVTSTPEPEPEPAPEPEPEPESVIETEAAPAPALEGEQAPTPPETVAPPVDVDQLAAALLRQVARTLDSQTITPEEVNDLRRAAEHFEAETVQAVQARDEMSRRLAETLEENQRFRRKLSEATDLANARRTQIERLVREKNELDANLKAAIKASGSVVDAEVRKRLERVMRAAPGTTKGEDDT